MDKKQVIEAFLSIIPKLTADETDDMISELEAHYYTVGVPDEEKEVASEAEVDSMLKS